MATRVDISDIVSPAPKVAGRGPALDARAPTDLTPRTPVVLLIDASYSIAVRGQADALQAAVSNAVRDMLAQPGLHTSADLAIVLLGTEVRALKLGQPVAPSSSFVRLPDVTVPDFEVDGVTLLGEGLALATGLIVAELARLHAAGQVHNKPNLVITSDGQPTDELGEPDETRWRAALPALHEQVAAGRMLVTAVGFADASRDVLCAIAGPNAVHLGNVPLSTVLNVVSASTVTGAPPPSTGQAR